MDSEEVKKITKNTLAGKPQTDQGRYYHEVWWESYKGIGKGYLGGAIIGVAAGAAIGVAALAAFSLSVGIPTALGAGGLIASFAAGGMLYGAHQFSEVGKITGAVAAAQDKAEQYEKGQFFEIKKEISELKAMVSGKRPALATEEPAVATASEQPHRTTHCDGHCPPDKKKFVFWKVATLGLTIGMAAGALLVAGGVAGHVMEGLRMHAAEASYAAVMTTMGLFGASFGINRDMFRQVFDKTDLLFKGILSGKSREPQIDLAPEKTQAPEKPKEIELPIVTLVESGQTNTYHRERLASMKLALLNMDHREASRQ